MKNCFPSLLCALALAVVFSAMPLRAQEAMGEKRSSELFAFKKFELLHSSASRIAPVVESALRNACAEASAECVPQEGENSLLIMAPRSAMSIAESLVRALDSPRIKRDSKPFAPDANYCNYHPKFISAKAAAKMIAALQVDGASPPEPLVDQDAGIVYWKHGDALDGAIERLMGNVDSPQTQMRVCFKAYRLDLKKLQGLYALLSKSMEAESGCKPGDGAKALMESIKGVQSCGEAEVSIFQGAKVSSAILDAGKEARLKIAISYPVVDVKKAGAASVYADFVFEYESDIRNSRWTIASEGVKPIAAFFICGSRSKGKLQFLDIGSLPETLAGKRRLAISANELLVITGGLAASEE